MKELFNYIKDHLKYTTSNDYVGNNKIVDIHTWGDERRSSHFDAAKKLWEQVKNDNIIEVDGQTYLLEHIPATNGKGGMDQGSPETIRFKKINPIPIKIKDLKPEPVKEPDFAGVIAMAKDHIRDIDDGSYHEDSDDVHYFYEEVMKAVYGKDIFTWINKNS